MKKKIPMVILLREDIAQVLEELKKAGNTNEHELINAALLDLYSAACDGREDLDIVLAAYRISTDIIDEWVKELGGDK